MNAIATPVSETHKLAAYLKGLGYPVASVIAEDDELTGSIVLFDTNPEQTKGVERARLSVTVDFKTKGRGAQRQTTMDCVIHADRWYKNGRRATEGRYMCGDLSKLEFNLEAQESVAVLVRDCLLQKREERVFDWEYLDIANRITHHEKELRAAHQRLEAYRKARWAKEDAKRNK